MLVFSLFVIANILVFSAIGLSRSVAELRGATILIDETQALHAAEAGIDGYLTYLRDSIPGVVDNRILNNLNNPQQQNVPCYTGRNGVTVVIPNCTILGVTDDPDDQDPTKDSNKIIFLTVRGTANAISQTIQATIFVDTSNPTVYPYSVAGKTINMDGSSTFGDPLAWNKTIIYAQGPPGPGGSFLADNSNNIWAGRVAFYNPTGSTLAALCPTCTDPNIFHHEPITDAPTAFDTNAPKAPNPTIDLEPYYEEAVYQGAGHVITSNQTFKDTTLSGVYYVECGRSIKFQGTVTVNGTIVHEGCGGTIELLSNANLIFDSTAGVQPFSPGMAIIGEPNLLFKETANMNITGMVMSQGGDVTNLKAHGEIHGSLIAVADISASYPELVSGPGPGSDSEITFPLSDLRVENAKIVFSAIGGGGGGPTQSGVIARLRAWILQ